MNSERGTVDLVAGKPVLRFERRLAHPPGKVWRAITDPTQMAHWFPATVHTDLAVGAPMRFTFGDDAIDATGAYADGEILEYDPPKVYAFRWATTVLRFELVPDGSGCRLLFSQTLSGTTTADDLPSAARQMPGWDHCLDVFSARLEHVPVPPWNETVALSRAEHYVEKFGLGQGQARPTDGGWTLRFERDLPRSQDRVWATLVADDEPVPGRAVPARCAHDYLDPGSVTAVEPARLVEYEWRHDGDSAGRVRFELRDQEPIGTRLVVTQTVPTRLAAHRATLLAAWQVHLELLFAALHGEVRCPWPTERADELRQRYEHRLGG